MQWEKAVSPFKLTGVHKDLGFNPFPFWVPLVAIFVFAGGAALQAVSECPRRR